MNPKSFSYSVQPWTVLRENKEYSTPIFELFKRRMRLQSETDFSESDFYIITAPAWINIIPITAENEVVLVEQYRYGIEEPTLEIPGGMVDGGEQPMEAAKRELVEETGYQSENWSSLGTVSSNPSIMDNYTHFYLAENCEHVQPQNLDEHERIKIHLVPMDDFLEQVRQGVIHHSIVVAAVARYLLMKS